MNVQAKQTTNDITAITFISISYVYFVIDGVEHIELGAIHVHAILIPVW